LLYEWSCRVSFLTNSSRLFRRELNHLGYCVSRMSITTLARLEELPQPRRRLEALPIMLLHTFCSRTDQCHQKEDDPRVDREYPGKRVGHCPGPQHDRATQPGPV
jgi:hypothetical protein